MKQLIVTLGAAIFIALTCIPTRCDGKSFQEDSIITQEEKKILDKFKALVEDRLPLEYMKKDIYLIKWLRHKRFNINDAETALMTHVKWREDNKMDTILQEDWSDFDRDYKYNLESRDKEGRPILYISVANWDLRQGIVSGNREKLLRYIDKGVEETCKLVRALGDKYQNVSQAVLLMDIGGFSLAQHGCLQCVSTFLRLIFAFENHIPGYMEKIILVNVPQLAYPIINLAQTVSPMPEGSVLVFGTDKTNWQKMLRKYIDEDQLPHELGGTKIYPGTEDNEKHI